MGKDKKEGERRRKISSREIAVAREGEIQSKGEEYWLKEHLKGFSIDTSVGTFEEEEEKDWSLSLSLRPQALHYGFSCSLSCELGSVGEEEEERSD